MSDVTMSDVIMNDDSMSDVTMSDETKVVRLESRLIKTAKDLEVFKRAYRASLDIHRVTLEFPKIEQYALADQLRRATKSICANIAEGFGKQRNSAAEFRRFLSMAQRFCFRSASLAKICARFEIHHSGTIYDMGR